jgi:hypothetical protein
MEPSGDDIVVRGVVRLHIAETGPNQHADGLRTGWQQIVPNRVTAAAVDGVHLLPAQVVQNEQVAARPQDARQTEQRGSFVGKVGKAVVADDKIEPRRGKGKPMGVGLDHGRVRAPLPGAAQHLPGQVDRDHTGAGRPRP